MGVRTRAPLSQSTSATEAYNDQYVMFTPTSKPQPQNQSPNLKAPTYGGRKLPNSQTGALVQWTQVRK